MKCCVSGEWCFTSVAPDFPPALGSSCVHVRRGPCSFTDGLTASGLVDMFNKEEITQ